MIKQIQIRPTIELLNLFVVFYNIMMKKNVIIKSGSDLLKRILEIFNHFINEDKEKTILEKIEKYSESLAKYHVSVPENKIVIGSSVYEYPKPITFNVEEDLINPIVDFLNQNAKNVGGKFYKMSYIIKLATYVAVKEEMKLVGNDNEIELDVKMKYKLVSDIIMIMNHSDQAENLEKIKKIISIINE